MKNISNEAKNNEVIEVQQPVSHNSLFDWFLDFIDEGEDSFL